MSYVQGTMVHTTGEFTDPETGAPVEPDDVIVTIERPDKQLVTRKLSLLQVTADPDHPGRYTCDIDTSLLPGTWTYQYEGTGSRAVTGRKQINVRARVGA